ncbi:MAG: hypothetical protein V2J62_07540 [candidate division KSB1 bacterium]|jgi:hypothetical protein|nr:hypothetical protein [candidate division KSB1 bacterium]
MTAAQTIWTTIFAIAVLLFLIVEIVVIIGGAWNLIDMMKFLKKAKDTGRNDG